MKVRAIILSALLLGGASAIALRGVSRAGEEPYAVVVHALEAKDTSSLIKQLILQMKEKMEVDADQFPELIGEVSAYAASCEDSAAVALLHSMVAEMYQQYYQVNRWQIDQRTPLGAGYVPDDIRVWSANLFDARIREELERSLRPAELLQSTSARDYKELLTEGKDSPELRPTLYEFLAYRALEIRPDEKIYKGLIACQNKSGCTKSLLLTELDYIRYLYDKTPGEASRQEALRRYDELYRELAGQPYAAEILIAKQDLLMASFYNYGSAAWDSLRAEQVALCREGVARYAGYPRVGVLRNRLAELEQPTLSVDIPGTVYPDGELTVRVSYKNVPEVEIRLYESSLTPAEIPASRRGGTQRKSFGKLAGERLFRLSLPNRYTTRDTVLTLPVAKPGVYGCVVSAKGEPIETVSLFSVSRLATVQRESRGAATELLVTDYRSGKPVESATVTYYGGTRHELKVLGTVQTDEAGLASLPENARILAYQASRPGDAAAPLTNLYPRGERPQAEPEAVELSLFTDRGIYRPGQTLFFKGIAYARGTEADDRPRTVAGRAYTIALYDANNKEVAKRTYITNDYGSIHGEFTLPRGALSGHFRLSAGREGNAFVRVEEYKRPTFLAEFQPVREVAAFGDTLTLTGKAATFSGVALPEGDVTWRIVTRPSWWRGYYRPNGSEQVAEGTARLSADGTFRMSFTPKKPEGGDNRFSIYQNYEAIATVTDSKGETQEARRGFSVGEASMVLSLDLPSRVDKDSVSAVVRAYTLNNIAISARGDFRLVELKGEESFTEGRCVASGGFVAGAVLDRELFAKLSSGRYRLSLSAKDSLGRPVKSQRDFILYGQDDKRPPVFAHTWLLPEQVTCAPGEEARILFGTSDKDAYVLYEWHQGNTRLHRELVKMGNSNRTFRVPFEASYGDGIVVSFTFVKEGKLHHARVNVLRERPDRALTIKPLTFRDRALPGSRERWSFRVVGADSSAVAAEVLASMYDASLDQLAPFGWRFSPERTIFLDAPRFTEGAGFRSDNQYARREITYGNVPQYAYDRLNWFDLFNAGIVVRGFASSNRAFVTGAVRMKSAIAPEAALDGAVADVESAGALLEEKAVAQGQAEPDAAATSDSHPSNVRQDFAETAFFYPVLVTDSLSGEVSFDLSLPESNTTWKLQLLANTRDLRYGQLTRELITSKPVMVVPNLPRFLRQGDRVTLSAQVINNSEGEIAGRVRLELFDPASDQPVLCLSKSERPFALRPDSVATVGWSLPVPDREGVIGVRIVADSEQGGDGEQTLLPVLTDRVWVTDSHPFYLADSLESLAIRLPELVGSTPFRLTLEMSANPIWYAVQALPMLTQTEREDALSYFAAYYGNTLASHIARSNPRIRQVIDAWTAQGGNAETLYSNLSRNEELKNILLEETPWVLEAADETERKQRLSLLFDLNRAESRRASALRQLERLQEPDGGWSWFKGFPASRHVTLSILRGMARLTRLGAIEYGETEKRMQMQALNYLDRAIRRDYEELRRNDPQWQEALPSSDQLAYLYVRSAYRDIPEPGDAREAIRFYTDRAEAAWKRYDLMGKGEIAILMHRNGKRQVAGDILAWLEKTATRHAEKGMYWANNRRVNSAQASPIETHCLLMEAFERISPDRRRADRLKQWLLNQKRTQDWESQPATADAIYALLLTGSDWLGEENACVATWQGKRYGSSEGETGTGYVKALLPVAGKLSGDSEVTIRKSGSAPAWGAVYAQSFRSIAEVGSKAGEGLSVDKRLFVETLADGGRQLVPVTEERPLRVGDKAVVRITLRTDRDLDYVCLKDLRAGCFEPASQASGVEYRDGLRYYRAPRDLSENFFFDHLPVGTYVLEYPVYVAREGEYAGGVSTLQCLYAPEFVARAAGGLLRVR